MKRERMYVYLLLYNLRINLSGNNILIIYKLNAYTLYIEKGYYLSITIYSLLFFYYYILVKKRKKIYKI